MRLDIPPIKSQGIKTKLVHWIKCIAGYGLSEVDTWIEPFLGTGVVAFNIKAKKYCLSDSNPNLIEFYRAIKAKTLTARQARQYLEKEGEKLQKSGADYYYEVRERFNHKFDPLDFLFLNRACFNGMMRFNSKGLFNVPFCKKNDRFSTAYITKICNQIKHVSEFFHYAKVSLRQARFDTVEYPDNHGCILYCDPPYIDRYCDYFNSWNEADEVKLFKRIQEYKAYFIVSTWHHNKYRKNIYIDKLWNIFNVHTREHFYHLGGQEANRNSMVEALVTNIASPDAAKSGVGGATKSCQLSLC